MSRETGQSLEERLDAVRQDLAFAHLIDIVEGREVRADAMLRAEAEQDMLHILNEHDASPVRSIQPSLARQATRFPRLWSLIALSCLTAAMAWLVGAAYPMLRVIFGF